LNLSIRI